MAIARKPAVFPVNNLMAICFYFALIRWGFNPSVLDLWLLIWSLDQCGYCILDSTFIGFCPVDCHVFDRGVEASSQCFAIEFPYFLDWSIPFDRWLVCTCDLMIASVEEAAGWRPAWGRHTEMQGHFGIRKSRSHLLMNPGMFFTSCYPKCLIDVCFLFLFPFDANLL